MVFLSLSLKQNIEISRMLQHIASFSLVMSAHWHSLKSLSNTFVHNLSGALRVVNLQRQGEQT